MFHSGNPVYGPDEGQRVGNSICSSGSCDGTVVVAGAVVNAQAKIGLGAV
jgi:hypothetical protein